MSKRFAVYHCAETEIAAVGKVFEANGRDFSGTNIGSRTAATIELFRLTS